MKSALKNTISISPQEQAARIMEAPIRIDPYNTPEGDYKRLIELSNKLTKQVINSNPPMLTDEELRLQLTNIWKEAKANGIWREDMGQGSDERIAYAMDRMRKYRYTEERLTEVAIEELSHGGLLDAIRSKRKTTEYIFKGPVTEYLARHRQNDEAEEIKRQQLRERTFTMTDLTEAETVKLAEDFPSGNFVYHGTDTQRLIGIFETGMLMSSAALGKYEKNEYESGRRNEVPMSASHNSGYEGVSWSMNGIDALPGDRYHMAGLVAAPETILQSDQQFAIPSRPAPNEVIQISGDIDAKEFYEAKTQLELYRRQGAYEAVNSVFDNLHAIQLHKNKQRNKEPMLYRAKRDFLIQPDYKDKLRALYSISQSGKICLDPSLLQQVDDEIPVVAVWLQAAVDIGCLDGTSFANKELLEIIDGLNGENWKKLFDVSRLDLADVEAAITKNGESIGDIEVPVENMYLVIPRKDLGSWLEVIACSPHQPAGILLYDNKTIRLENFASRHRGSHDELTRELQMAIRPDNKDYIPYDEMLGVDLTDDIRSGYRHHVIGEQFLSNRRTIRNEAGKLVVKQP